MNLEKLWSIATKRHELEQLLVAHTAAAGRTRAALGRLEFLLIEQAAETDKMRAALKDIYELAGWHCDDDADPNDDSPNDANAHTNGLIRKKCLSALTTKPAPRNVHHHPDLGEDTKRALSNQENMIDD